MKKKMKSAEEKAMLPEMKKLAPVSKDKKKSKKKFNFLAMIGKKKKK